MAIQGNISTEFGDVLTIRASVPIIGLISLTDFIDNTSEQGNHIFKKEFRYSTDGGLNYSQWIELTVSNLNGVQINSTDTFLIEYRYTHINDVSASFSTSDSIAWNSTQLDGVFEDIPCGMTYQDSIFADFFNCKAEEVLAWCVNVTEKLYKQGIVPKFLTRGNEGNINGIDRDYIDFWRSVACFFAYIVVFARKFEDFKENDVLLGEFLKQRGVFFCDAASQADKNYLVEYYFDEIRQRGTSQIYKTADKRTSQVDGELLRLLCYNAQLDEFIFNVHLPHTIGWSVENSSPLYKGLSRQTGVIKGYEFTKDFEDVSEYPTFGNASIQIVSDGDDEVLSISDIPIGEESGIGGNDLGYKITIDDDLTYEITFFVRQVELGQNLNFGAIVYDSAGNTISAKRIDTGANENYFFRNVQLNKNDKYYLVRGIIYGKDVDSSDVENNLAIGHGKHLQFQSGTYGLIPIISVNKDASDIDQSESISLTQGGWSLLNSNLTTIGDNGTFEDIEANWTGLQDDATHSIERSSNYAYQGSYSCRAYNHLSAIANLSSIDSFNREATALNTSYVSYSIQNGRRYVLKAKIRAEVNAWPNRSGNTLNFNFFTTGYPITDVVRQYKTHSEIENNWQEISIQFVATATSSSNLFFPIKAFWNSASSQNALEDGEIYVDQIEMLEYEFIDAPEEESQTINLGDEVRLWDVKVRPLQTEYSTGFVTPKNFISIWGKKRKGELSDRQLEYRLRKYLLPYNSTFKFNYLDVEQADALGDYDSNSYNDDYFV